MRARPVNSLDKTFITHPSKLAIVLSLCSEEDLLGGGLLDNLLVDGLGDLLLFGGIVGTVFDLPGVVLDDPVGLDTGN